MDSKFRCKKCKSREDEENILELCITEHHYQKFNIKKDGTLIHVDADADQEIYLECPLCGTKYEFDVNYEKFCLQMEKRHVVTRLDFSKITCDENPIVNLNDYKIVEKGEK